jgi:2-polyprenyl-6-methoxyphenol hydroxylase-like FAD-dependent oxidoreductase
MRESLFISGKDISQKEAILTCAINSGLNIEDFLHRFENGEAQALLDQSLDLKKEDKIRHFPSFILENSSGERRKVLNITEYAFFEDVTLKMEHYLSELLGITDLSSEFNYSLHEVLRHGSRFSFSQLKTITSKGELELRNELVELYDQGEVIMENIENYEYFRLNQTPYKMHQSHRKDTFGIIGGGICGGFLKVAMDKSGLNARMFERQEDFENKGFGFLILKNGIDALDALGLSNKIYKYGNHINHFRAITPENELLHTKYLENCIAIGRDHLHDLFRTEIGVENIHFGKEFSHFETTSSNTKVQFSDATNFEASAFLATDGFRSGIRTSLFPNFELEEVGEREIVCTVEAEDMPFSLDEFLKVVDLEAGKALGIIPLNDKRYVWFLQFNQFKDPIQSKDPEVLRAYVFRSVKEFPEPIKRLLEKSNFENAFLWVSQRMEHLPAYYNENILLMGDAAHPLLPLTSQGANSALEDVAEWISVVSSDSGNTPLNQLFAQYDAKRRKIIDYYISHGDELVAEFLRLSQAKTYSLPLTIH